MNKQAFDALVAYTGLVPPEGIDAYVADIAETGEKTLLDRAYLAQVLQDSAITGDKSRALTDALDIIESDEQLLRLSLALRQDALLALNRCTACEFVPPVPTCIGGFARDAYAFLFALSCVQPARSALRARGVPETYDTDIPERMIRKQLAKYVETGDITFDDYPWDMNFYCCAIFFFDRFYFIPYLHEAPTAYRSRRSGSVIALWPAGARVRSDGQLDGVNGITDENAFTTIWIESETDVTANPVRPDGIILRDPVTLDKREYACELAYGDDLLALHIPGGEGYTPQRVRSSMQAALAFYRRYYPEIPIKGFWSESWLYDPTLKKFLPEDGHIISVQKQFYCYPTPEGDEMIHLEVFGDTHAKGEDIPHPTHLQRALTDAFARGERFYTTGMFVLLPEVERIGSSPYWDDGAKGVLRA